MSKNSIIQKVEQEQLKSNIPEFGPGDTVVVQVRIKEGDRERLQAFEGVVIGKRNRGLNSAFTVRKISHGVGVERTFQTHSNQIESIAVKRRGDVRQAKLYYLRDLSGRAARIAEKLVKKGDAASPEAELMVTETQVAEMEAEIEKSQLEAAEAVTEETAPVAEESAQDAEAAPQPATEEETAESAEAGTAEESEEDKNK